MYLRSIGLEGYRSAPHGSPLILERLGQHNILIGPNNSGKSTVLRFLEVAASLLKGGAELPFQLGWAQADSSWWWQSAIDKPITATLIFGGPAPAHTVPTKADGRFEHDDEWRVSITITASPPEHCTVLVAPHVYINDGWYAIARPATPGGLVIENLNRTGQYVSSSGTDNCPYHPAGLAILQAWAKSTRFYDPVRAIDRDAGRRQLADGSNLLKQIRQQQLDQKQAHAFEKFRRRLVDELNRLLFEPTSTNLIESFEIKGEERLDLYVKRQGDEAPIALQYMGTGIAELTILLADILQSEGVQQYFVEEPECHLHPGLLRRLMVRLRELSKAQFFVTTHSNAVLDSTTADDGVYRFGVVKGGGTTVQRCSDVIEKGAILDALGVSGSALLQTNCVLWVEGPSDRVYLRRWMGRCAAKRGLAHIEGSDFSFVFYGGKILSHFAFADDGPEELISLIRVCRFSAVVMDLDTDPSDPSDEVRHTKARVRDEATKDPHHRAAVFSVGREIENDVDLPVFRNAVAAVLNVDREKLAALILAGSSRYPEEIVTHLKLTEPEAKTAIRKLKDKVSLAEAVDNCWTDDAIWPPYVDDLVDLIERSRVA
jgi:hypothetical protein